jgi:hypothetical protein
VTGKKCSLTEKGLAARSSLLSSRAKEQIVTRQPRHNREGLE